MSELSLAVYALTRYYETAEDIQKTIINHATAAATASLVSGVFLGVGGVAALIVATAL